MENNKENEKKEADKDQPGIHHHGKHGGCGSHCLCGDDKSCHHKLAKIILVLIVVLAIFFAGLGIGAVIGRHGDNKNGRLNHQSCGNLNQQKCRGNMPGCEFKKRQGSVNFNNQVSPTRNNVITPDNATNPDSTQSPDPTASGTGQPGVDTQNPLN